MWGGEVKVKRRIEATAGGANYNNPAARVGIERNSSVGEHKLRNTAHTDPRGGVCILNWMRVVCMMYPGNKVGIRAISIIQKYMML